VNTSMYDAQQGSTSGAHIDMSTGSGTNDIHGQALRASRNQLAERRSLFLQRRPEYSAGRKESRVAPLHRGRHVGLPIIKNKLFFYGSYQHTHASDDEIGISRPTVPPGLTNNRSAAALAAVGITTTSRPVSLGLGDGTINPVVGLAPGDINPIAYTFFNYKLPNGQYLIPSANPNAIALNTTNPALIEAFPEDAEIPGTAYFIADQAVADLDWNPNSKHSFSAKYYYQHDPTTAPYAYSSVAGFPQHLDAGSQVISLSHTQIVKPNLSITETFGFIREKAYSTVGQPFTPAQFGAACQALTGFDASDCTINTFGSRFPRHNHYLAGQRPPFLSALVEYRRRCVVFGGLYRRVSRTASIPRRTPSGLWAAHLNFRRKFRIHAAQHAGSKKSTGDDRIAGYQPVSSGPLNDDYLYAGTLFSAETRIGIGEPTKRANISRINFSCAPISPSPRACVSIGKAA
jgi:hypothetical protein